MTYTDYIKSYNDRIEREKQLVAKYSQPKCEHRNNFIWMSAVEQHTTHNITASHVFSIIAGILLAGLILVASIFI